MGLIPAPVGLVGFAIGVSPIRLRSASVECMETWNVVVWNDEVNLAAYVAYVFRRVLGMSRSEATEAMLDIHRRGSATVISGTREHSELNSFRLQVHGLLATLERA